MALNARKALVIGVALLGIGTTAALGRWQLSRAAQKEQAQATLLARQRLPALDGAALARVASPAEITALLQRSVALRGTWLADEAIYLDNRIMDHETGFLVLTPLQLDPPGQGAVLVIRGWAPRDAVDPYKLPRVATPAGPVSIQARLVDRVPTTYAMGRESTSKIRQNIDLDAFRAETGLALAPVVVEQVGAPSEGLQRDWLPPASGVERNYGYAVQWFSMAALIAALILWFQLVKPILATRRSRAG